MALGLLFDTSVLICHLRGEDLGCTDYVGRVATADIDGFLSLLTVSELYAGEKVGEREEGVINQLLQPFQLVSPDTEVAALAGRLVRQWRRSHGLGLVDALIGATALTLEVPVVTLNVRHFQCIPGLVVLDPTHDS